MILNHPPAFSMLIQAKIPSALAALHNFIMDHDPHDHGQYSDPDNENSIEDKDKNANNNVGEIVRKHVSQQQCNRALIERDRIATAIWDSYVHFEED